MKKTTTPKYPNNFEEMKREMERLDNGCISEIAHLVFDNDADMALWKYSIEHLDTGINFYDEICGDFISYWDRSKSPAELAGYLHRAKIIEMYADDIIDYIKSTLHGARVRPPSKKHSPAVKVNVRKMF